MSDSYPDRPDRMRKRVPGFCRCGRRCVEGSTAYCAQHLLENRQTRRDYRPPSDNQPTRPPRWSDDELRQMAAADRSDMDAALRPQNGQVLISAEGTAWRFGFFGWVRMDDFRRPAPSALVKDAIRVTRREAMGLGPLARCGYARDLVAEWAR